MSGIVERMNRYHSYQQAAREQSDALEAAAMTLATEAIEHSDGSVIGDMRALMAVYRDEMIAARHPRAKRGTCMSYAIWAMGAGLTDKAMTTVIYHVTAELEIMEPRETREALIVRAECDALIAETTDALSYVAAMPPHLMAALTGLYIGRLKAMAQRAYLTRSQVESLMSSCQRLSDL